MDIPAQTFKLTWSYMNMPKFWLVLVGVTIVCFFGGPFGTLEALPGGFRLIYWGLIVLITGIVGLLAAAVLVTLGWHQFHQIVSIGILFGICVSAIVIMITYALLNPFEAGTFELLLYSFPSAPIIFVGIFYLGFWTKESSQSEAASRPALFARLKKYPSAKQILSLKAQDHYVEVTTELGPELCLMRLADAIAEATPVEGVQIHRSVWVAKSAIKQIDTKNSLAQVQLKNGIIHKVSQSRRKELTKILQSQPV